MSVKVRVPFFFKPPQSASEPLFANTQRGRGLQPTIGWTLSSRMPILALFVLFFVVFAGLISKWKKDLNEQGFLQRRGGQVAPWQAADQGTGYFTAGSSKSEVRGVQGMPTWVEGDTWHYGWSKVHYRKGRVKGWSSSPEHPLKARMVPSGETTGTVTSIRVGATKDDVLRLHGTPTRLDDDVWEYGYSKIFFRSGKVVAWADSPANPLLVDRGRPGRKQAAPVGGRAEETSLNAEVAGTEQFPRAH